VPAAAFALLALVPAAAQAATLRAAEAERIRCAERLVDGPGTDRLTYTAERAGLVTLRLRAASGDWDLALFTPAGGRGEASASAGPTERVTVFLSAGESLVAQACRRTGGAETAELDVDLFPYTPPATRTPAALVEVPLDAPWRLPALEATGVDVTHAHDGDSAKVVLYGEADRQRLRAAGFTWRTITPDLRAYDQWLARAAPPSTRALPSGRVEYRRLADYQQELKALAEQYAHVRHFEVGRSLENRPIEAVEIGARADAGDNGRPVLAVFGLHHAREWPSGEMPMEFAIDLARGYATGDPRIRELLLRARVIVIPVVNPDGFVVSRSVEGFDDGDERPFELTAAEAVSDAGAYKRKNCRPNVAGDPAPCATRTSQGVDLNRNYGAYYGGEGSSTNPAAQNFRGAGPFSEPESEAIHRLSSTRSIVNVISHHTFTDEGVWLRQPGFCFGSEPCGADDVTPDEAGMRALGDSMGAATGWLSELGWDIGEITGATEDWNYFATGAYGYTPEQRGPNFHPAFAQAVAAEYDGTAPGAQGGVREALLRAAEQAADPAGHAVLTGAAPAGSVLRLRKAFATPTSIEGLVVQDQLDIPLTVPASGRFEWHVNQSTRPLSTQPEAYRLTCEANGASRDVVVRRGQTLDLGDACAPQQPGGGQPGGQPAQPTTATPAPTRTAPATQPRRRTTTFRLAAFRAAFSARTLNRRRRISVRLRVDGVLRNVVVRLVDARGRTIASRRFARLARDGRVTLLARRRARAGRHRLVVTARTASGRTLRATRAVRVR